jgi:hypothetical protein
LRSDRTVLATARESGGRRRVVLGFGLDDTDLVERPAFPLLVHNAIVWLAARQAPARSSLHPGVPLAFGGDRARVEAPGGRRREARGGAFYETGAAGVYRVAGRPFAVSGVDFAESLAAPSHAPSPAEATPEPPLALWLALALLAVIAVEWLLLHRGRV